MMAGSEKKLFEKFSISSRLLHGLRVLLLASILLFLPACSSLSNDTTEAPLNLLVRGLPVLWMLLIFVIVLKLLDGTINTRGLLLDKNTGTFSPARLQLLIFTIVTAVTYIGTDGPTSLSKEDANSLMELMGGTNGVYLAAKGWPVLKKSLMQIN